MREIILHRKQQYYQSRMETEEAAGKYDAAFRIKHRCSIMRLLDYTVSLLTLN